MTHRTFPGGRPSNSPQHVGTLRLAGQVPVPARRENRLPRLDHQFGVDVVEAEADVAERPPPRRVDVPVPSLQGFPQCVPQANQECRSREFDAGDNPGI